MKNLRCRTIRAKIVMVSEGCINGDPQRPIQIFILSLPLRIVRARHAIRIEVIAQSDSEIEGALLLILLHRCSKLNLLRGSSPEISKSKYTNGIPFCNDLEHRWWRPHKIWQIHLPVPRHPVVTLI